MKNEGNIFTENSKSPNVNFRCEEDHTFYDFLSYRVIPGAVAGNVIMGLGGKDNSLGNIGKVILDNIISGKFRRDVRLSYISL